MSKKNTNNDSDKNFGLPKLDSSNKAPSKSDNESKELINKENKKNTSANAKKKSKVNLDNQLSSSSRGLKSKIADSKDTSITPADESKTSSAIDSNKKRIQKKLNNTFDEKIAQESIKNSKKNTKETPENKSEQRELKENKSKHIKSEKTTKKTKLTSDANKASKTIRSTNEVERKTGLTKDIPKTPRKKNTDLRSKNSTQRVNTLRTSNSNPYRSGGLSSFEKYKSDNTIGSFSRSSESRFIPRGPKPRKNKKGKLSKLIFIIFLILLMSTVLAFLGLGTYLLINKYKSNHIEEELEEEIAKENEEQKVEEKDSMTTSTEKDNYENNTTNVSEDDKYEEYSQVEDPQPPKIGKIHMVNVRKNMYYVILSSSIDDDLAKDSAKKLIKTGMDVYIIAPEEGELYHKLAISRTDSFVEANNEKINLVEQYGKDLWILKY